MVYLWAAFTEDYLSSMKNRQLIALLHSSHVLRSSKDAFVMVYWFANLALGLS